MEDVIALGHWTVEEFGTPDFEGSQHRFLALHPSGWLACVLVRTASGFAEVVGLELVPAGTHAPWSQEIDLRMGQLAGDHVVTVDRYPDGLGATPEGGELNVATLRSLDLGGVLKHCKQVASVFSGAPGSPVVAVPDPPASRVRLTDLELAERCALYLHHVHNKTPSPHKAVAAHYGYGKRTAEGWISKARERGVLGPANGRKPGGELTDYGKHLIAQRERQ